MNVIFSVVQCISICVKCHFLQVLSNHEHDFNELSLSLNVPSNAFHKFNGCEESALLYGPSDDFHFHKFNGFDRSMSLDVPFNTSYKFNGE